jgi:hypothetical protein
MTSKRPPIKDLANSPRTVKYLHDSNANHPVYEREDIAHGINCECCTKIAVSERLAEQRAEKIRELHKGRNERARQKQRQTKAKATEITPIEQPQRNNWDPLFSEDFEE